MNFPSAEELFQASFVPEEKAFNAFYAPVDRIITAEKVREGIEQYLPFMRLMCRCEIETDVYIHKELYTPRDRPNIRVFQPISTTPLVEQPMTYPFFKVWLYVHPIYPVISSEAFFSLPILECPNFMKIHKSGHKMKFIIFSVLDEPDPNGFLEAQIHEESEHGENIVDVFTTALMCFLPYQKQDSSKILAIEIVPIS